MIRTEGMVDFVIVNYNSAEDTLHCVEQLRTVEAARPENIFVVDNNSPDKSGSALEKKLLPEVNVILSDKNGGFAAGVNVGARKGSAPFILILNPDCFPREKSLDRCVAHFEANGDVGIIGLDLINPDGSLQYSARRFYSLLDIVIRRSPLKNIPPFSRFNRQHLMMDTPRRSAFDCDWVMGTGLMIRRELFEQLGGLDETYFLYMEDVDLCARCQLAGYKVQVLPQVQYVHDHRRASGKRLWSRTHSMHLESLKLFARKYGLPWFKRPSVAELTSGSTAVR